MFALTIDRGHKKFGNDRANNGNNGIETIAVDEKKATENWKTWDVGCSKFRGNPNNRQNIKASNVLETVEDWGKGIETSRTRGAYEETIWQ